MGFTLWLYTGWELRLITPSRHALLSSLSTWVFIIRPYKDRSAAARSGCPAASAKFAP